MNTKSADYNLQFIARGGEMGALIRAKDWSKTPLGPVYEWPQSLRTTLSILLNSKFPMFLWWGPELICFYNDAYRPSLGINGKHPSILGMKAEEAWTEIWAVIKPLIDQVLSGGESIWSQDQLIPIYRNGRLEDVYWTFSYSPVNDESGKVAGVLVTCTETTDKVNTVKSLEESNRRYINNIMQTPAAMCILRGKDHVVEIANDKMLELWDKKPEQVMNKPLLVGLPEVKGQGIEPLLENVYKTGEPYIENERPVNLSRNGRIELTYISFVYEALKEPDGSISGIVAIATDVTCQVVSRREIEDAEQRLRLATEFTGLSTWDLDLVTDGIVHSPGLAEIFGHSRSAILTHSQLRSQIHPGDKRIIEEAFNRAMRNGTLVYEARIMKPDNEICWVRSQGKVLFNDAGKPVKMIGTSRDITEERLYQQELLESEQKFRLLADSMPQHVWTSDTEGNLNYYNRSVFDYTGLTFDQINKDGWLQIVHPDDRENNVREWQKAISSGTDFLYEHRFRRHDGEYRWQLSRAIPQRDAQGNIQMWVGTSTDIQTQKIFTSELEDQVLKRTAELEQKNKDLAKMNAELQSFAYVSSHDLQEPLRKIQTFAARILEEDEQKLSESGKDHFRRMQNAAKRMQVLIDDLLAYSRTNTTDRHFEKVNLNNILEQVKADLKEEIQHKNAVIEANLFCDVNIIPFQFQQLLHNVIGNSLKFSKPNVPPLIKLNCEIVPGKKAPVTGLSPDRSYYHLTISDNGIGFEPQYKERIFEVFQRLHGKDEYKGTGIGLAIVKKVVENHNGIVTANSEENKGATFDIYIDATET